jgi:hypothetical protein
MKIELTFLTACLNLVALFIMATFFGKPVVLIAADAGILIILGIRLGLGEVPRRFEKYFLVSIIAITTLTLFLWII